MQLSEVKGLLHTVPQTNPSYLNMHSYEQLPNLHNLTNENEEHIYLPHFNTYNSNTFLINPQIHHRQVHEFSSNTTTSSSSLSNKNSNSIEAKENPYIISISHERKQKRLVSNRESARRSRMRKRKQLEELQLQVIHLQNLYHKLTEKFINLLENNHQVLQENAQLREEIAFFQKIVNDVPCDAGYVRNEDSNQIMSDSMEMLH